MYNKLCYVNNLVIQGKFGVETDCVYTYMICVCNVLGPMYIYNTYAPACGLINQHFHPMWFCQKFWFHDPVCSEFHEQIYDYANSSQHCSVKEAQNLFDDAFFFVNVIWNWGLVWSLNLETLVFLENDEGIVKCISRYHFRNNCLSMRNKLWLTWCYVFLSLTHCDLDTPWDQDKMTAILLTTFSVSFSLMKIVVFYSNLTEICVNKSQLTHWGRLVT